MNAPRTYILHWMWKKIKQNLCVFIAYCYFVNKFLIYIMITYMFYLLHHDHIDVLVITSYSRRCFIYYIMIIYMCYLSLSQQVIGSTSNYNLIKIKCLFYLFFFFGDTLICRVTSWSGDIFQLTSQQSTAYWYRGHRGRHCMVSWIYNYLRNQCLSPLKLWVRTLFPPPIKLTATI